MHAKPLRLVIPVLLILALAAGWYFFRQATASSNGFTASGSFESVKVQISPEIGGRVAQVFVKEGERVQAGETLVQLDETLLAVQRRQAQAALAAAEAGYSSALAAAGVELTAARQALKDLEDTLEVARAQAREAVVKAESALEDALEARDKKNYRRASKNTLDKLQADAVLAKKAVEDAEERFSYFEDRAEDDPDRAATLRALANARSALERVEYNLNYALGRPDALEVAEADARVEVARSRLADAERRLERLKDGPDPDAVELLNARIENANAAVEAAKKQVDAAQANLELIETQLGKLALVSPIDGVVTVRAIEPGEFTPAGAVLLEVSQLDELTLTVYVSEDRYGQIVLGQTYPVKVDSFPGQVFTGRVTYISDKAEFTPRNVQTTESRKTTVFAVRLSLSSQEGRLKPGMPADVNFAGLPTGGGSDG